MVTSLWGEIFDKDTSAEVQSVLSRLRSPKKVEVSVEKLLKSKKTSLAEKLSLIEENVLRILGVYKERTVCIRSKQQLADYIDAAIKNGIIAIDTETNNSLDPLTCLLMGGCIYTPGQKNAYIPIHHVDPETGEPLSNQLTEADIKEQFDRLGNTKVITHNGTFDFEVLKCTTGYEMDIYWDTMLGARMLDENERAGLKTQYVTKIDPSIEKYSIDHLFKDVSYGYVDPDIFALYAATDAYMTYKLYLYQVKQFEDPDLAKVFKMFMEVEMPLIKIIAGIELSGVCIDQDYAKRLQGKYRKISEEVEEAIAKEVEKYLPQIAQWRQTPEANIKPPKKTGEGLGKSKSELLENPPSTSSPTQLAILLYDVLKVPPVLKDTPRGTGEEALQAIDLPLCKLMLEKRGIDKLRSVFVDKLPEAVSPVDGRLHAHFNQYGAGTGRFSCIEESQPILTNEGPVPIRDILPGTLVYCYDDQGGLHLAPVSRVIDNGWQDCIDVKWQSSGSGDIGHLICTPDHRLRLKSGEWVEAKDLTRYSKIAHLRRVDSRRPRLYGWNKLYVREQDVIKREVFRAPSNCHIHHKDGNPQNNCLSNLQILTHEEHCRLHALKMHCDPTNGFGSFKITAEWQKRYVGCGKDNGNFWNASKKDLEHLIYEAKGKLSHINRDYATLKKKIKEWGVDVEAIRRQVFEDAYEMFGGDEAQICQYLKIDHRLFMNRCKRYQVSLNHMVQRVTFVGTRHVYDLEIPAYHNFIAGELNVHNCSDPNVQQIPSHNREIRMMFRAAPGYKLVGADFSQQEPKI